MSILKVWAPNAQKIELVHGNKLPFDPPIYMVGASITYKNTDISGYWDLPPGINFPLNDGDGYWFKIFYKSSENEVHYKIDPVIEKSIPNILLIFKSLPRTKSSFFKNAQKGLLNAVFAFMNHAHFRDNANGGKPNLSYGMST